MPNCRRAISLQPVAADAVPSGIVEMLLQNQEGDIHLLPALPSVWPTGQISGLRARGGFIVDITWDRGALTRAVVHATRSGVARMRYGGRLREYRIRAREQIVFRP